MYRQILSRGCRCRNLVCTKYLDSASKVVRHSAAAAVGTRQPFNSLFSSASLFNSGLTKQSDCVKLKFENSGSRIDSTTTTTNVNEFVDRSHTCGEVNDTLLEQTVCLSGWIEYKRLNKFIVLRDSYGTVQLFIRNKQLQNVVKHLNFESVIRVKGKVMPRPAKDVNPEMPNGNVEVSVDELVVLNSSKANMPILIRDHANVTEKVRLQYRYIDLRRPKMIENLRLRSKFVMNLRKCLADRFGFIEVETPTLFKATPGGAQEFIVPTRFANQFYSLVQSPQQFKQLLMVGGIDRYFQIARCYRDEGTKSDRQPEFTQLDIEMSFTTMDSVMRLVESVLEQCWPILEQKSHITTPFGRIDYAVAMEKYGCDKPDLRRPDIEIQELMIDETDSSDGCGHYLLVIPQDYDESFTVKSFIEEDLDVQINTLFFKGHLNHFKLSSLPFNEPNLNEKIVKKLNQDYSLKPNDFIWIASGQSAQCRRILGRIRACMIERIEEDRVVNRGFAPKLSLLWVENFPLFLENESGQGLEASHHPFTAPKPSYADMIYTEPEKVIGQNFDLVINGREMGGGSIRIIDYELQRYILGEVLKCDTTSMEYFFEALNSGCPPHGGFAIGLDRLVALLCHEPTLRDVIAFPKSAQGKDLMANSPSQVDRTVQQLYRIATLPTTSS